MSDFAKQQAVRLLRQTGCLPLAENLRKAVAKWGVRRANRLYCRHHPDVAFPPAELCYDPLGSTDYARYWETGRHVARHIAEVVLRTAGPSDPVRVLEWGCGPARVIRHLPQLQSARRLECFGTDYNARLIDWCRAHLPGIEFRTNGLTPPLDFPDGFFDFVYGLSVFTHLSEEMHHAWLAELRRVTKPGGTILLSLHGSNYRSKLLPDELARFEAGELVARGNVVEGSRMYASFHSERFVRDHFFRNVEILSADHRADNPIAGPQSVWIIRKPPG